MTITYSIPGLPLLNQLNETSNPRDDCVFTSNAAIAMYYNPGKHYTGSQIKALDNNYGASYVGFASQANLLDTMATLGVRFARVAHPTQADLITELHRQISFYHQPCIITMPSQWNSAPTAPGWNPRAYRGPSHVGVMCGVGNGMLRCMNPWGGFWQDQSDAWWTARLLEGEIWVACPAPKPAAAAAATAPVAKPVVALSSDAETIATLNAQIVVLQEKVAAAKVALG